MRSGKGKKRQRTLFLLPLFLILLLTAGFLLYKNTELRKANEALPEAVPAAEPDRRPHRLRRSSIRYRKTRCRAWSRTRRAIT